MQVYSLYDADGCIAYEDVDSSEPFHCSPGEFDRCRFIRHIATNYNEFVFVDTLELDKFAGNFVAAEDCNDACNSALQIRARDRESNSRRGPGHNSDLAFKRNVHRGHLKSLEGEAFV
jgi:hypothetical protein